jgi:hypothetical protein
MKFPIAALFAIISTVATAEPPPAATLPESGTAIRIDGDMDAIATWNEKKGKWLSGGSDIDTALPVGYPPPTPPGSIDIKTYPSVRRAEIADEGNRGFMPLFRHIQRNKIAMTAPVEMDYETTGTTTLRSTSMSFLYYTPDLHETGTDPKDARITIRDAEPITVISMGGRGSYDRSRVQKDAAKLRAWLAENPTWEEAGEPRALMYNGPSVTPWNKWLEVQIPVRVRDAESKPENDSPTG